jgi:hypothetical protein
MDNVPDSNKEKIESFKSDGYLEHWMYVSELEKLLSQLKPDDWITPNEVHNLSIGRDDNPNYGYIDFLNNTIEVADE